MGGPITSTSTASLSTSSSSDHFLNRPVLEAEGFGNTGVRDVPTPYVHAALQGRILRQVQERPAGDAAQLLTTRPLIGPRCQSPLG